MVEYYEKTDFPWFIVSEELEYLNKESLNLTLRRSIRSKRQESMALTPRASVLQ